jgi:predicted ATPase/DNA-binding CsgD family transcriptional regulator
MALHRELDDVGISAREAEVLAALGDHLTNAEIAERLYISVRTVESHVSSLLRKLGADDRRALARLAGADDGPAAPPAATPAGPHALPSPLTPFVGRVAERAALADALADARLVTALGPGGVGKTRLALSVAGEAVDRFPGGVWYVDLVPVTGADMVVPAVAAALAVGEQPGRPLEDTVASRVGSGRALLVFDNCEHLVDGVAVLVERLLTRCPGLTVLATSRIRLVLPFERPFPVPGLSLPVEAGPPAPGGPGAGEHGHEATPDPGADPGATGGDGDGDAVALFLARAAAVGASFDTPAERRRVAEVCRALDGMALAIELAASRLPVLGLDGLEAGLGDRLRVLTGGSRADGRHRSLRATLDWSYALAAPADRAVLRRAAVFAAPFTAAAVAEVAGGGGPGPDEVADALARLVDQSLLVAVQAPDGTRYRALEVVRQYAFDAAEPAELAATHDRHLRWSVATAAALAPGDHVDDDWRAAFDRAADDLRAALSWASSADAPGDRRATAAALATSLAALAYRRGRATEAQHRYEEAAALATDGRVAAEALEVAAAVAANRQSGDDAFRLYQEAADAAMAAGDEVGAARRLALAATTPTRCPGIMVDLPPPGADRRLLDRAQALAAGHPEVDAVLLVAEAFQCDDGDPLAEELAARAVQLARRQGDAAAESAALDILTATQLAMGEAEAAAASARRRTVLLVPLPMTPGTSFERVDAYQMGAQTALAAGDLASAWDFAERVRRTTSFRETPHLGLARLVMVDALAGDWDAVVRNGDRWLASWVAAGRPVISNLGWAPVAASLVYGIRGDDDGQARWVEVVRRLRSVINQLPSSHDVVSPLMAALVATHRGRFTEAVDALDYPPDRFRSWFAGVWRHLYAAAWAEAAVLAGTADAIERLARARLLVGGDPLASPLLDRAEALAAGDRAGLLRAAAALDAAGSRYQWARTLALAGGPEGAAGQAALDELGAAPMAPAPVVPS